MRIALNRSLSRAVAKQIIFYLVISLGVSAENDWTNSGYPDIRGAAHNLCVVQQPKDSLLYICDPDNVLNATQQMLLNGALKKVAVGTPCHCQRRSQCSSGGDSGIPFHGFVVSIAIVDNLQMTIHSPSEQQLTDRAESFCKTLEGRWALGDCGNSVIVFVWRHYKKMLISPARLAERYITSDERKRILMRVNDLIQNDRWPDALIQVLNELHQELKGDPAVPVDTGTISLVIAVGVASALTILVTFCVCAFRICAGKEGKKANSEPPSRMDSLHAQPNFHANHSGQNARLSSFTRSPNFTVRRSIPSTAVDFLADCDTTMV